MYFFNLDSGIFSIFTKENVNWAVMAGNFCNCAIKVGLLEQTMADCCSSSSHKTWQNAELLLYDRDHN